MIYQHCFKVLLPEIYIFAPTSRGGKEGKSFCCPNPSPALHGSTQSDASRSAVGVGVVSGWLVGSVQRTDATTTKEENDPYHAWSQSCKTRNPLLRAGTSFRPPPLPWARKESEQTQALRFDPAARPPGLKKNRLLDANTVPIGTFGEDLLFLLRHSAGVRTSAVAVARPGDLERLRGARRGLSKTPLAGAHRPAYFGQPATYQSVASTGLVLFGCEICPAHQDGEGDGSGDEKDECQSKRSTQSVTCGIQYANPSSPLRCVPVRSQKYTTRAARRWTKSFLTYLVDDDGRLFPGPPAPSSPQLVRLPNGEGGKEGSLSDSYLRCSCGCSPGRLSALWRAVGANLTTPDLGSRTRESRPQVETGMEY